MMQWKFFLEIDALVYSLTLFADFFYYCLFYNIYMYQFYIIIFLINDRDHLYSQYLLIINFLNSHSKFHMIIYMVSLYKIYILEIKKELQTKYY